LKIDAEFEYRRLHKVFYRLTLGTIAAGIVLISNPVGWFATACIIVGAGSAIYGSATVGYDIYDEISGD